MKPIAVIFDFDGVVADSFDVHRTAWIDAFHHVYNVPFPDLDPENLTGQSSMKIAETICDEAGVSGKLEEFFQNKTARITDGSVLPPLLPGVREMVELLKKGGVPFAVASNAPKQYLEYTLEKHDISIPVVLGFESVQFPKPAPDLFLKAAENMGVDKSRNNQVVVFEDSVSGLNAAREAGMVPVGIRGRFTDDEMREAGAVELFSSLLEVVNSKFLTLK